MHMPKSVGDAKTDPNVLNKENEFRSHHRYAVVVQDLYSYRIQCYPTKNKLRMTR